MNRYSFLSLALLALAACTAKTSPDETGGKGGPLAFATGPAPKDTAGVATGDLFPSMSVTSDDAGIHVWAALLYTVDDFLPLGAGDTLTATVDGVTRTLERDGDTQAHYTTTFPPSAAATNVVISLQRTNGQPSAPNNVVALAAPFTLAATGPVVVPTAPLQGPFDLSGLYVVAMNPAPAPKDTIEYSASGACVPRVLETPQAALAWDVHGGGGVATGLPSYLDPQTTDCAVAITIDVRTQGTWDPALQTDPKTDVLEGSQRRVVDVMVAPTPVAAADGK